MNDRAQNEWRGGCKRMSITAVHKRGNGEVSIHAVMADVPIAKKARIGSAEPSKVMDRYHDRHLFV
jgi:hypothetical protein